MQNPEPSVEFDTVANTKQQHEVNVGKLFLNITVLFVERKHWKHQKKRVLGSIVKLTY